MGNVQNLVGQSGTLAQGMSFSYTYNQGPDAYVDEFDAAGGTVCFRDQSSIGRVINYGPGSYRTITSAVIYGAQRGADRNRLMAAYVNYLVYGLGLEGGAPIRTASEFLATPNPACAGSVRFSAAGQYDRVTITGADGRTVAEISLSGQDTRTAIWDCRAAPAGTYIARVTGSSGTVVREFVVLR
jgi:hypothetical protein